MDESWEEEVLGNLFDGGIGRKTPRKEKEWVTLNTDDIKWISIKDLGSNGIYIDAVSEYLTQKAIENLDKLLLNLKEEVKIVFNSSWNWRGNVDFFKDLFKDYYFSNFIIDKAHHEESKPRNTDHITSWLKKNNVTEYVIIDGYNYFINKNHNDNFVHNNNCLLSDIHVEKAIKILNF